MNAIVTPVPVPGAGLALDTSKKTPAVHKGDVAAATAALPSGGRPQLEKLIAKTKKKAPADKTPAQIAKVVARAKKPLPRPGEAGYKAPAPKVKASPLPTVSTPPAAPKPKAAPNKGGKPSIYGKPMITTTFKATEEQRKAFRRAGGNVYLRTQLDGLVAHFAREDAKGKK